VADTDTHTFLPPPKTPTVTSSGYLPEYANITAKACVMTYVCYTYDMGKVDICSSLTSDSGATCPDAGTYSFSNAFSSPGSSSWEIPSWVQGYTFSVSVSIQDFDGTATATTCKAKASTAGTSGSSSSSSSSAGYITSMGVAAVALVTGLWVRRRKLRTQQQQARISLLEMEHNPSRNQLPKNSGVVAV
jgi:hypothetical protein